MEYMIDFDNKDGPLSIIMDYVYDISIIKSVILVSKTWKDLCWKKHKYNIMMYLISHLMYYNSFLYDEINILMYEYKTLTNIKYPLIINVNNQKILSFIYDIYPYNTITIYGAFISKYMLKYQPEMHNLTLYIRKQVQFDIIIDENINSSIKDPLIFQYVLFKACRSNLFSNARAFTTLSHYINLEYLTEKKNIGTIRNFIGKYIEKIKITKTIFFMLPNEIWVNHVANKVKCCELTFEEMTYYLLLCKKFKHKSYVANDRFNNLQVDSQKIGKYYIKYAKLYSNDHIRLRQINRIKKICLPKDIENANKKILLYSNKYMII